MPKQKTSVVIVGGGNGSAVIIRALKPFRAELELSAVISMSDSGGSSGALREHFQALPPGDVLRSILAFSGYDYQTLKKIFYTNRITNLPQLPVGTGSRGHSLGNLFLALLARVEGDFVRAVRALEEVLEAVGVSYPVTLDQTTLLVELSDKAIVRGEAAIDRPGYARTRKIKRAWLEPAGRVYRGAAIALKGAEAIVLSPGSLYTSVVATLLPKGVTGAIANSQARLIYVAGDAYELHGETGPDKLSDFVTHLERYLPRPLDAVVYHNQKLTEAQKGTFRQKNWGAFAKDAEHIKHAKVLGADLERTDGGLSAEKIGKVLHQVILPEV